MTKKEQLATINKIRINDKEPKQDTAKVLDQVYLLSKSTLWGKFQDEVDKWMTKYHNLPEEEQIRTYPELLKLYTVVGRELRQDAEWYEKYRKHGKPAMRINDENDTTKTVIDSDYFKDIKAEVEIDFPYQSIAEIMKDKSLPTAEKSVMISKYLEAKYTYEIKPAEKKDEAPDIIQVIKEASMDTDYDDDEDSEDTDKINRIEETKKSAKEMFIALCEKYPKKFNKKKKSGYVGYTRSYRGRTYIPDLITVNPYEYEARKEQLLRDSTTLFLSDEYFVKELNAHIYFLRTSK